MYGGGVTTVQYRCRYVGTEVVACRSLFLTPGVSSLVVSSFRERDSVQEITLHDSKAALDALALNGREVRCAHTHTHTHTHTHAHAHAHAHTHTHTHTHTHSC